MSIILNGTTGITTPDIISTTSTLGSLTQALDLGSTGQIVFPATQNASSNANTLDDYEEGTFTATWWSGANGTGTNLGTSTGNRYTKVGRFVSVSFARSGIGSGYCLSFTGLPFVPQIDGSASGITADSAVFYFNAVYPTMISFRGSGDGEYSRGTANYSTT